MIAKAVKALVRMAPVGGLALLCLLPAVFLPATVAAASDGPYLSWGAKNAPVQQAGNAAQVPVPPSPYGQVGDPYLHVLNWSAKSGSAQPSRPTPPPPVALPDPEPVRAYSPPQYRAQPAPRPALAAQAPLKAPAKTPAPSPAQAPGQASVAPPDDGAYHVPASSPYAARIAAARAAQSKTDQAKAEQPKAIAPAAANPAQATQGQAALTDAPADDDKPFVPGEHYTDASEAPRLYSLHRAYGLKPDPITVDSNASGAVLDTSHIDAADAKGMKGDKTDEDSDDDDGVPAKSTDAPSASGTQKASAGKTEKTAQ
jgi:hypothetical protein